MWNEEAKNNSVDCDSLKLATRVGIFGVIFAILLDIIYTYVMMLLSTTPHDPTFYIIFNNLSAFGFAGAILTSVGFVGVFSMKRHKRGIIFPLMIISLRLYNYLYLRISYELGVFSSNFHANSIILAGYLATIIGGLLILSIRNTSDNSQYLILFSIIYILQNFLSDAIWYIVFGFGPIQITTALDYILSALPDLLTVFAISTLTIIFFILESRQGCIDSDMHHEVPFLE